MKIKIEVAVEPFITPNYVQIKNVCEGNRSVALSELDSDTLDQLCDDFRDSVFKKANKNQPPKSEN